MQVSSESDMVGLTIECFQPLVWKFDGFHCPGRSPSLGVTKDHLRCFCVAGMQAVVFKAIRKAKGVLNNLAEAMAPSQASSLGETVADLIKGVREGQ